MINPGEQDPIEPDLQTSHKFLYFPPSLLVYDKEGGITFTSIYKLPLLSEFNGDGAIDDTFYGIHRQALYLCR